MSTITTASALVEALSALHKAEQAINEALTSIGAEAPVPMTREMVAVRTTETQVLAVLAAAAEPLTMIDIADGVVALRRGEDKMCRTALMRLIFRGLVRGIKPTDKRGLMRFERVTIAKAV